MITKKKKIRIIDFGFAANNKVTHSLYCGTPSYMAPEVLREKGYEGEGVDVWALGVLLFKLLTGFYPFGGSSFIFDFSDSEDEKLKERILKVDLRMPECFGPMLKDLFSEIFLGDPNRRITLN